VGTITIFARMGVKSENAEKLTALATEACRVAAEEPGTLIYDWHYSEEHGSLVVLEAYADSPLTSHTCRLTVTVNSWAASWRWSTRSSSSSSGHPPLSTPKPSPPSRERSSTRSSRASSSFAGASSASSRASCCGRSSHPRR
jgi:hypothetical protein